MTILGLMAAPPAGEGGGGGAGSLVPIIAMWGIILFIFYFLMIRPQQKKQREAKAMLESLKQGDRILTTGGLYGTVKSVKDENVVVLKIADQVQVEVAKSAVTAVVNKAREA